MSIVYFKIPLELGTAMEAEPLRTCDIRESIRKNLELIITTRFGEHRSDPSFGCEIWDLDFELIVSARMWEEKLRQSMQRSVATHEHRLSDMEIGVSIVDMEKFNMSRNSTEIKKRVDIRITGIIHKTGESFQFNTNMFLSPLSLD